MGKVSLLDLWWQAVITMFAELCCRCDVPLPAGSSAWSCSAKLGMAVILCEPCMVGLAHWWQGVKPAESLPAGSIN